MKLLDTSAWVEFFKGSEKGLEIKKIIENSEVYTSIITFAEISKWFIQNKTDVNTAINQIKNNSIILGLDENILVNAGKNYIVIRKISKDIGLIDVIIYTTCLSHNLNFVTSDSDFKDLENVVLI